MSVLIPDPEHPNTYLIGSLAEPQHGVQIGIGVLSNVHPETQCAGRPCVVHNPSDHHMRDWDLNWRDDRGLMERICPHGVGHPDPDTAAFHEQQGQSWMNVHGCDGCCSPGGRHGSRGPSSSR